MSSARNASFSGPQASFIGRSYTSSVRFSGPADVEPASDERELLLRYLQLQRELVVSATVGVILRFLADRAGFLGKIIIGLLGAAWSIATYFIVPVMIFEKRSLRDSVKQSTQLIAKTWGESLVAAGGIGAFILLLAVAGLILPIAGFFISPMAALIGLGVMVVYWIALSVMSAALTGIFRTALYLYATEGRAPAGFSPDHVQHAFAPKKTRGVFASASRV